MKIILLQAYESRKKNWIGPNWLVFRGNMLNNNSQKENKVEGCEKHLKNKDLFVLLF